MKNDQMLYRFLSGIALKVIAVVSMTIDHIAYYILDQQLGMGDTWLYETMRCFAGWPFPSLPFSSSMGVIILGTSGNT